MKLFLRKGVKKGEEVLSHKDGRLHLINHSHTPSCVWRPSESHGDETGPLGTVSWFELGFTNPGILQCKTANVCHKMGLK